MNEIDRNGFAPFRFLTPFPQRPSQRLRNSARQSSSFGPNVRVPSHSTDYSYRAQTYSAADSIGFPRWPTREG